MVERWCVRSPEAVRYGGFRYSSPQPPGSAVSSARARAIAAWSAVLRANLKTRWFCSRFEREDFEGRTPTMTAATAGCSSTQRVATLAIEMGSPSSTCPSATARRTRSSDCNFGQPPQQSTYRRYLARLHEAASSSAVRSARSRYRSVSSPPASTPNGSSCMPLDWHRLVISPAARRSSREYDTWFVTTRTPLMSATRAWSASKLHSPTLRTLGCLASSSSWSSHAPSVYSHVWSCSRSIAVEPRRERAVATAASTVAAVACSRPGMGTHFVRHCTAPGAHAHATRPARTSALP